MVSVATNVVDEDASQGDPVEPNGQQHVGDLTKDIEQQDLLGHHSGQVLAHLVLNGHRLEGNPQPAPQLLARTAAACGASPPLVGPIICDGGADAPLHALV
eukprot:8682678-Pyramimonas_sp.AAC.1